MGKCVQCGFCCTRRACCYGEWDAEKKQCAFLTEDMLCAKYGETEIMADTVTPAFGAGCCSALNDWRMKKLQELGEIPADMTYEQYFGYCMIRDIEEQVNDESSTSQ